MKEVWQMLQQLETKSPDSTGDFPWNSTGDFPLDGQMYGVLLLLRGTKLHLNTLR